MNVGYLSSLVSPTRSCTIRVQSYLPAEFLFVEERCGFLIYAIVMSFLYSSNVPNAS